MSFASLPNPSYNTIRGLTILISDIRNCTTKADESKRVEQELDKIRKVFSTTKSISGYDKKKCVWKLLYIYILGYRIDFGYGYMADLITSLKFSEKTTGYISMSMLFKEDNSEIETMTNSIRNDINGQNSISQGMALTLVTNLNNTYLMDAVAVDVARFLTNFNEKQPHTVKKALICLTKIIKVKKEIHNPNTWSKAILKMIDMKNFEVLLSLTSFIIAVITTFGTSGYEEVGMKLLNNILYQMKSCPPEYIYYHIKAPWLQIKILKILQLFSPHVYNNETLSHIKEYVEYIYKKTHSILLSSSRYSRFYAEYCIFFEVINLIDLLNRKISSKVFDNFIQLLGSFLQDDQRKFPNKDVNTKYLALDALSKLCKYSTSNNLLNTHMTTIFESLHDNDVSIRRRALDLAFTICSHDSVKVICKELLQYFLEDEPQLKEDVALKIAILSEKYASDLTWYIDTCLKTIEVAGEFVSEEIIFRFIQIVTGFEGQEEDLSSLQIYAADKLFKLLESEFVNDNIYKLSAYIFGEFGNLLAESDITKSLEKQIELLQKHINIANSNTNYYVLNALVKLTRHNPDLRIYIIPTFELFLESWDTELQQRVIEFIILCKNDGDDENLENITEIRNSLIEKMPLYSEKAKKESVLIRTLEKKGGKKNDAIKTGKIAKNSKDDDVGEEDDQQPEIKSSLKEKDLERIITKQKVLDNSLYTNHILYVKNPSGFSPFPNRFEDDTVLINKELISNLDLFKSQITTGPQGGIIYSDNNFKIEIKVFPFAKGFLPVLMNFIGDPENIKVTLLNPMKELNTLISGVKYPQDHNSHPQILMKIAISDSFSNPLLMQVDATSGNIAISCQFALPILINKFLEPLDISYENYNTMLFEYSNSNEDNYQKFDAILANPMNGKGPITDFLKKLGSLLHTLNYRVYPPQDKTNFHEIDAVAMINLNEKNKICVLTQASFVPSFTPEFRLSIRAKCDAKGFDSLCNDLYSIIKFYVNPY